jgi:hypothetical protein
MSEVGAARTPRVRPVNWWAITVAALTFGFVCTLGYLGLRVLEGQIDAWAASYGYPGARDKAIARRNATLAWLLAVAVAGPTIIAVIAAIGRLRRTAIAFGVIALPPLLFALYALANTGQAIDHDLPGPNPCIERGPEAGCPPG